MRRTARSAKVLTPSTCPCTNLLCQRCRREVLHPTAEEEEELDEHEEDDELDEVEEHAYHDGEQGEEQGPAHDEPADDNAEVGYLTEERMDGGRGADDDDEDNPDLFDADFNPISVLQQMSHQQDDGGEQPFHVLAARRRRSHPGPKECQNPGPSHGPDPAPDLQVLKGAAWSWSFVHPQHCHCACRLDRAPVIVA